MTTTDTTHPVAAVALKVASKYPQLLAIAGAVKALNTGTIGRTGNVHGIPGGTEHHNLARETRDVLADYAEKTRDAAGLTARWSDVDPVVNARLIATHAAAAESILPEPCVGHEPPEAHADLVSHLSCVERRIRNVTEPKGARVYVGTCPEEGCGNPLRAHDHGPVRCALGHKHDTATVREVAVREASERTHTLTDMAKMSLTLWGRRVEHSWLEEAVRRGRLVTTRDSKGRHLVRASDVAAVLTYGKR